MLLGRYSGQDDVVVGTPVSGRGRPELDRLVGILVNTLPLRTDLTGNPRFTDLLARARDTVGDAQANRDVPFERLVSELNLDRPLSHAPALPGGAGLAGTSRRPSARWAGPG